MLRADAQLIIKLYNNYNHVKDGCFKHRATDILISIINIEETIICYFRLAAKLLQIKKPLFIK